MATTPPTTPSTMMPATTVVTGRGISTPTGKENTPGGGINAPNPSLPSDDQNLTREEEILSLRDMVATHAPPLLARLTAGDLPELGARGWGSVVRIHRVGRRKMVMTKRVQWDGRRQEYLIVSDQQVDIPADCAGKSEWRWGRVCI